MNQNLIEMVDAFESTVRAHENMGSQPREDYPIIQNEYDHAKDNLLGEIESLSNNPALAVIQYIMDGNNVEDNDDAMVFLNYWNEGKFDILRRNWENIPDEVFIGADSQFVPKPRIRIGRHINGITLNELEYILNDDGEVLTFKDESEARDYLLNYAGFTEDQIDSLTFEEVENA